MNLLTSINLGVFLHTYNLSDSLKMIRECGFDGVDFSLWYFCQGEDAPLFRDDWREFIKDVRRMLYENGLTVPQAHAHWRHDGQIREDFSFDLPGEIFRRNIEACRMLGCSKLVFHPIQHFYPIENEEETRRKVIAANAAWFSALTDTAEEFGVQLLIENLFDYKHIQPDSAPPPPLSRGEDIMETLRLIRHPLVNTCLDTGHAHIAGCDIPAMIRLYGKRLQALHLQDNYGRIYPIYEDIHQFPGTCSIDWKNVFAALKETDCDCHLNMELSAKLAGQPKAIQLLRCQNGRMLLLKMAEVY
ncbi:MAG: sugar phosphate isomerase/epimerase [Clostridia bacterium]|nr:sugar phosphate isomerase/epimerase [Clostridia bacterium]